MARLLTCLNDRRSIQVILQLRDNRPLPLEQGRPNPRASEVVSMAAFVSSHAAATFPTLQTAVANCWGATAASLLIQVLFYGDYHYTVFAAATPLPAVFPL